MKNEYTRQRTTPRLGVTLENMGWNVEIDGGRTLRLIATRADLPETKIEVYIRNGIDGYRTWNYYSGERIIAHSYSHGDLIDYLARS